MKTNTINSVNIKLFTYEQLSEQSKEQAYNNWLKDACYYWHDDNIKSLEAFCEHYKIKCYNWEYSTYNYSYRLEIENEEIETLSGIRLYGYLNNLTEQIKPFKLYYKGGINGKTKFWKSRIIKEDTIDLTGYCADYSFFTPIIEYLKNPELKKTYRDIIEDSLNSFFQYCKEDYEYNLSKEHFAELCETNDWVFFSNGKEYFEGSYELAS